MAREPYVKRCAAKTARITVLLYIRSNNFWACILIIIVIRIFQNLKEYTKLYSDVNQFIISTVDGQSGIFLHNTVMKFLLCFAFFQLNASWNSRQFGNMLSGKGWGERKTNTKTHYSEYSHPTLLIMLNFVLK